MPLRYPQSQRPALVPTRQAINQANRVRVLAALDLLTEQDPIGETWFTAEQIRQQLLRMNTATHSRHAVEMALRALVEKTKEVERREPEDAVAGVRIYRVAIEEEKA